MSTPGIAAAASCVALRSWPPASSAAAGGAVLRACAGDLHHVTPQIGVDARVLEEGRVLLTQRTDNSLWCMPEGSVAVGETLARAAERELREEAEIEGK